MKYNRNRQPQKTKKEEGSHQKKRVPPFFRTKHEDTGVHRPKPRTCSRESRRALNFFLCLQGEKRGCKKTTTKTQQRNQRRTFSAVSKRAASLSWSAARASICVFSPWFLALSCWISTRNSWDCRRSDRHTAPIHIHHHTVTHFDEKTRTRTECRVG